MPLGCMIGLPLNVDEQGNPKYEAGFRFSQCLSSIAPPMNFQTSTAVVAGKRIDIARNEIVEQALRAGAEKILFLDSDVLFPPNTFQQLISRQQNNGHKIVSGVYWSKSNPTFPLIFHEAGRGSFLDWKVGDYFDTWAIGMGLVLIDTSVFRAIPEPWYEIDYGLHVDAETGAMGSSSMTEDLPFCNKCAQAGIKVWVDTSIQAGHFDKHSGLIFGLGPDMPQAQGRSPQANPTLYVGNVLAGGEPADVLSPNKDIKPTWIGTPEKIPTNNTYDRVCVKDPDVTREALSDAVSEWVRVTSPGGRLEILHPDYAEWITEGRPVTSKALYPPEVIKGELESRGLSEIVLESNHGHHFLKGVKPNTSEPLVSMLVLAHGMEDMTRRCIETFRNTKGSFEIILIDNCSPEPLPMMGDKLVRLNDNYPFGVAMTAGMNAMHPASKYVLFLNNDTEAIQENWLENLLLRIRGNGTLAGVAPKQIHPTGTVYYAGIAFNPERIPYHEFAGFAHDHPSVQSEKETLALNFGCALVRRELMSEFPFDFRFDSIGNYEDVDWCLTVRQKGLHLLYTPSAEIMHHGARTQATQPERSRKCIEDNRAKLLEKWKDAPDELFGLKGEE